MSAFLLDYIELYKLLYGKTVALVGGKDDIDWLPVNRAELVVRVNQHYQRQGGRVDGLYMAASDKIELGGKLSQPPLFMAYRKAGAWWQQHREFCIRNRVIQIPFENERFAQASPYGPAFQWSNVFGHEIGCKPFTGTLAIKHLCSFPIVCLYITGMDFHLSSTDEPIVLWREQGLSGEMTVTRRRGPHNIDPQLDWLARYVRCDRRIMCDPGLKAQLEDWFEQINMPSSGETKKELQ